MPLVSAIPATSLASLSCKGLTGLVSTALRFRLLPALGVLGLDRYASLADEANLISSSSNPSPWLDALLFLGVIGASVLSFFLFEAALDCGTLDLTALWRFLICALPSAMSFCRKPFSVAILCFSANVRSTSSLCRAASSACSFCNALSFASKALSDLL